MRSTNRGGQTALNLALELEKEGILETWRRTSRCGVSAIEVAEDRELLDAQ